MFQDWQQDAACKATQPEEDWFTKSEEYARELARKYCDNCPVFKECKEYALEKGPEFGVWAGMTAARIRRERKAAS